MPWNPTRREALAAASLLIVKPKTAFTYQANSAVRIGLLGCGGRGTAVATSFAKNTTGRIVALADIFQDQLDKAKATFTGINTSLGYSGPQTTFVGPHAYEQLAASKEIDSVHIATPPFFHVEHLDAAIKAGKHAYCEKPLGVDVPQTNRALEIGKRAAGKVSLDVGFQIRSAPPFVELVRRIHDGALGKLVSISAHYFAPAITYPERPASMPKDELRLRNWNWDLHLSGDIVVEQDIHVIDICNWVLQNHPVSVSATGARSVLTHFGNNYDNYQVLYTYPNDIHVDFAAKQYGEDQSLFDVSEQVFGADGFSESPYSGPLRIVGKNPWQWQSQQPEQTTSQAFSTSGVFTNNLADADKEKDKAFIESIVSGKFHNQAETGVESARTAIMARMAAREKRTITWDELLSSKQRFELGFDLNKLA